MTIGKNQAPYRAFAKLFCTYSPREKLVRLGRIVWAKGQPGSGGYGEFLANMIKVSPSFDKKRLVFRMAGEQWSKYGVTVWENTLNDAGIVTSGMQRADDYGNIGTWKCTHSLKEDGKPDLVVKLERVG